MSVVIKKLSFREGHAPYLTKAQFMEKYSPKIVGDQKQAWEVYKSNMLKKRATDGEVSKETSTDS